MKNNCINPNKFFPVALVGSGFVLGLVALAIWWLFFVSVVPAGHEGVVVSFGSIHADSLHSGLNTVAPWNTVHHVNVRTQEDKEEASVPTKRGLQVQLEVSLLYSVKPEKAVAIFENYGGEFKAVLVQSAFKSAIRDVTAQFEAEDLYTAGRGKIETSLLIAVRQLIADKGIECEAVLLRDVELPKVVKDRIEAKLGAEQDAERMKFILLQAEQEAERKRVEAKGIADAQAIIKKDLDRNYLIYLWVEALKEHKNAIIYVPTGTDGLPVFKELK